MSVNVWFLSSLKLAVATIFSVSGDTVPENVIGSV